MDLDILRRLSEEAGVSGSELKVAEVIMEALRPYTDSVARDILGNVIALKKGEGGQPRPRVLLAAHMDEIGLMVTRVEEGGFLRFTTVGGVDVRTLLGQEVIVHGVHSLPGSSEQNRPTSRHRTKERRQLQGEIVYRHRFKDKEKLEQIAPIGTVATIDRNLQLLTEGAWPERHWIIGLGLWYCCDACRN